MIKSVIYCRVSSWSQLSWSWLDWQFSSCSRLAKSKNLQVISDFKDWWVSWWLMKRPWIIKMFTFIDKYNAENNNDKIKYMICDDISRFARDVQVHLELKIQLEIREMKLELVNQNFEETPTWEFIELVMAWNSQLFRKQNRLTVISRQTARLLDGYRTFNPPVWFNTITEPQWWKLLVVDHNKADILKEWITNYANWIFTSLHQIADFRKRKWLIIDKKSKEIKNIPISTVSRILKNILYAWYIKYQKTTRYKDWRVKHHRDIPLRKWQHEWIISLDIYNKVQKILDRKKPHDNVVKKVNNQFPLRGFISCSCCKKNLSSGNSKWRKESFWYYTFNKLCCNKNKWINSNNLHKDFEKVLSKISLDSKISKYLEFLIQKEFKNRSKDILSNLKQVKKEIDSLEEKNEKLLDTLTTLSSESTIRRIEQRMEDNDLKIKAEKEKLENMTGFDEISDQILSLAFQIMSDPLYFWSKWNVDQKRLLVSLVFRNNPEVDFSTKTFWTLNLAPMFLLSERINASKLQDLETVGRIMNKSQESSITTSKAVTWGMYQAYSDSIQKRYEVALY